MANEKRLIDAEKFLQWVVKRFKCVPLVGSCDNDSEDMRSLLAQAPTVEAVEVVHGRWILKSRIYKMLDDVDEEFYVECNLCNREEPVCFEFGEQRMLEYAKQHYPYCHCGAKMDGDGNG